MTLMEPAGIWNLGPRCLFIFKACDKVNVPCCAMAVKLMIPEAHIGMILTRHLTSSTSWMLHNHLFLGEPSSSKSFLVVIAALFKNLSQHQPVHIINFYHERNNVYVDSVLSFSDKIDDLNW